jgi:hypothetical protein
MGTARKPQDHQVKVVEDETALPYEEITMKVFDGFEEDGKTQKWREVPGRRATVQGVTVEVPEEAFDDFELIDDLSLLDEGEDEAMLRLPSILRRLIGPGYRSVYPALRNEHGRITSERGTEFVMDLVKSLNPNS